MLKSLGKGYIVLVVRVFIKMIDPVISATPPIYVNLFFQP